MSILGRTTPRVILNACLCINIVMIRLSTEPYLAAALVVAITRQGDQGRKRLAGPLLT